MRRPGPRCFLGAPPPLERHQFPPVLHMGGGRHRSEQGHSSLERGRGTHKYPSEILEEKLSGSDLREARERREGLRLQSRGRELQRQPARAGAPGEGGYLLNGTDPVAAEGERGAKAQRAGCSLLGSPSGASAIPAPVPSGAPPWDTIRDTEEERGRRPTGARLARSRG